VFIVETLTLCISIYQCRCVHRFAHFANKVKRQSDQVNTKERVLPVCDKPYYTNKKVVQKVKEIGVLRNSALFRFQFKTGGGGGGVIKYICVKSGYMIIHTRRFKIENNL